MKENTEKNAENEENVVKITTPDATDEKDAKILELTTDLQRMRADFENYRKQTEIQKEQAIEISKFATIMKFLPMLDDIDKAFDFYPKELDPLRKSFSKTLNELKLAKINSEEDVEFNPEFHEAVMMEDGDGEKEVIAETLRPGYTYDGKVARTAMVKVKKI